METQKQSQFFSRIGTKRDLSAAKKLVAGAGATFETTPITVVAKYEGETVFSAAKLSGNLWSIRYNRRFFHEG